jgi:hypothetical protein
VHQKYLFFFLQRSKEDYDIGLVAYHVDDKQASR